MYSKLVTVFGIALILALTACGRDEAFYSTGGPQHEVKVTQPAEDTVTTIVVPVEQAEEVVAQLEETQPQVVIVEENEDVVVVEVAPANPEQQQALDNVLKHCEDGKGKDRAKNKHCK